MNLTGPILLTGIIHNVGFLNGVKPSQFNNCIDLNYVCIQSTRKVTNIQKFFLINMPNFA